jgi:quercetin dioxygenase-like cupin family protein
MLAVGVGGAVASHVTTVDPATVPPGYLAGHFVFGPNAATAWHTHPGPAIVTVVSGTFSYQDAPASKCRTRTYTAGQGFFDPGFGHVHRESRDRAERICTRCF